MEEMVVVVVVMVVVGWGRGLAKVTAAAVAAVGRVVVVAAAAAAVAVKVLKTMAAVVVAAEVAAVAATVAVVVVVGAACPNLPLRHTQTCANKQQQGPAFNAALSSRTPLSIWMAAQAAARKKRMPRRKCHTEAQSRPPTQPQPFLANLANRHRGG